jgi:hypothetical protein
MPKCETRKAYDPIPDILGQFIWALSGCRKYRGSSSESKFRELAAHLWKELLKYLTE